MQLRDYLIVLWRRKWVILVTVFVTMAVVIAGTFAIPPTYKASITLRIATTSTGSANYTDFQYTDRLLNTYQKTITSEPVLRELNRRLSLSKSPNITAEILPNTELIQITVDDRDPILAFQAAGTLGQILIAQSRAFYTGSGKSPADILKDQVAVALDDLNQAKKAYQDLVALKSGDTVVLANANALVQTKQQIYGSLLSQYQQTLTRETIQANTISIASPVQYLPAKSSLVTYAGLGLVASLIAGLGLAFVFENLDTTLFTTEQIEEIVSAKALGIVPRSKKKRADTYFNNAFKQIGIKLLSDHNAEHPNRIILVTSSEKNEGKSTLITHLAYALAKLGKKVLVIDCDLRSPDLHKHFMMQNGLGLSDVLYSTGTISFYWIPLPS
jgi:capsular polysaccharide biosynthesis protein